MTKLFLLGAMVLAACNAGSNATTLPDLTTSLAAVRGEFNAHKAEPRFLTLLSAT